MARGGRPPKFHSAEERRQAQNERVQRYRQRQRQQRDSSFSQINPDPQGFAQFRVQQAIQSSQPNPSFRSPPRPPPLQPDPSTTLLSNLDILVNAAPLATQNPPLLPLTLSDPNNPQAPILLNSPSNIASLDTRAIQSPSTEYQPINQTHIDHQEQEPDGDLFDHQPIIEDSTSDIGREVIELDSDSPSSTGIDSDSPTSDIDSDNPFDELDPQGLLGDDRDSPYESEAEQSNPPHQATQEHSAVYKHPRSTQPSPFHEQQRTLHEPQIRASPRVHEEQTSNRRVSPTQPGAHEAQSSGVGAQLEEEDIQYFVGRLADQLVGFHGCATEEHVVHQIKHDAHRSCFRPGEFLHEMEHSSPRDVLGIPGIVPRGERFAESLTVADKERVFCGGRANEEPVQICLEREAEVSVDGEVTFDIDSVLAFGTTLAICRQGLKWNPIQKPVSDLQSGLHLGKRKVYYQNARSRWVMRHVPIHKVPHHALGRLVGFEDAVVYILFPSLYRTELVSARLLDQDYKVWLDELFLPALAAYNRRSQMQHYPASYQHSYSNARASRVEHLTQHLEPVARLQQLAYILQPGCLAAVWAEMEVQIRKTCYARFAGMELFLDVKNIKTLTKAPTWKGALEAFYTHWNAAVDPAHISEYFVDIGKETCSEGRLPEAYLWRRCCLESYARWFASDTKINQRTYPQALLHDAASITIEPGAASRARGAGWIYTQLYNSTKEILVSAKHTPFASEALESLSLDHKLRQSFESISGTIGSNPEALLRAYVSTKLRCHHGLRSSCSKSFGIREEHRIRSTLFLQLGLEMTRRGLDAAALAPPTAAYYVLPTAEILAWTRWTINKFCAGFEMIYHIGLTCLVAWEQMQLMILFLRCLRFAYGPKQLCESRSLWRDVVLQPDSRASDGLRRVEGLGFATTLVSYGHTWMLPKIDWVHMELAAPHAPHIVSSAATLRSVYRHWWHHLAPIEQAFSLIARAARLLPTYATVPPCQQFLYDHLTELCLRAFRSCIFSLIRAELLPRHADAAVQGDIPLTHTDVRRVLQAAHRNIHYVQGNRLLVQSVDALYAFLWEWRDGQFTRRGWANKPYRLLYQQAYEAIRSSLGKLAARQWKQQFKNHFLNTHWLLPYPGSNQLLRHTTDRYTAKRYTSWWANFHPDVPQTPQIEDHTLHTLHPNGWSRGGTHSRILHPRLILTRLLLSEITTIEIQNQLTQLHTIYERTTRNALSSSTSTKSPQTPTPEQSTLHEPPNSATPAPASLHEVQGSATSVQSTSRKRGRGTSRGRIRNIDTTVKDRNGKRVSIVQFSQDCRDKFAGWRPKVDTTARARKLFDAIRQQVGPRENWRSSEMRRRQLARTARLARSEEAAADLTSDEERLDRIETRHANTEYQKWKELRQLLDEEEEVRRVANKAAREEAWHLECERLSRQSRERAQSDERFMEERREREAEEQRRKEAHWRRIAQEDCERIEARVAQKALERAKVEAKMEADRLEFARLLRERRLDLQLSQRIVSK